METKKHTDKRNEELAEQAEQQVRVPTTSDLGYKGFEIDDDEFRRVFAELVRADEREQALAASVQPVAHIAGEIDHTGKVWKPVQPAPVQPVAWCRASFIEDTDGRRIGTDDPEMAWGKKPPDSVGWEPLCYCEGISAPEPVRECNSIDCQYIDGLGKTDCDWCRPKKPATPPAQPAPVPLTDEQTTDKDRLDWLNNNFFNRENLDWLTGNVSKESLMWVFFAPTKAQGDIRRVIDSAIDRENGITKGQP
jgi:hypothetical protein